MKINLILFILCKKYYKCKKFFFLIKNKLKIN